MRTVQVNLGMIHNSMSNEEVVNYMSELQGYRLMGYYFKDMLFDGQTEPTFVGIFEYKYSSEAKVLADFERLCSVFNQESIAIVTNKLEVLAYNVNYKGGGYSFNRSSFEYFTASNARL
jgi:hypothetical protein